MFRVINILNLTIYQMNKNEEIKLLTKLAKCRTRKCSKIDKQLLKERKILDKEQGKKCSQKTLKCSLDIYKKSKYKTLFDKFVSCGEEKCYKERKNLTKYQKNIK